ncbi:hypothetical protein FA002_18520 [Priestia megaterium]|nr:hypothetical protein FA002_18520 [Priestia megaterium]
MLVTPQLISVQDLAFRGRPVSLLVAYAPAGSHLFRFPAGVFVLPSNQQLEATTYSKPAFTTTMKKSERGRFSIKNLASSFGSFFK